MCLEILNRTMNTLPDVSTNHFLAIQFLSTNDSQDCNKCNDCKDYIINPINNNNLKIILVRVII